MLAVELNCRGQLVVILGDVEQSLHDRLIGEGATVKEIEEYSRSSLTPRPMAVVVGTVAEELATRVREDCHQRGILVIVVGDDQMMSGEARLLKERPETDPS
ncbi:MAG: hypothetical protein ABI743_12220 [bacterium]